MGLFRKKLEMPDASHALAGRREAMPVPERHYVNGNPLKPPYPANMSQAIFGMGCFWGAERRFWECEGVFVTAVGYLGGYTPNPTYEEVCSGMTGHNEVVLVVFNPDMVSYENLLALFWESHNPTQGMRQGNDLGTQYRSGIYTFNEAQSAAARKSLQIFQDRLEDEGYGGITTEIQPVSDFYYAEHYHQQYLAKVPNGYCGLGGTGVCYAPEKVAERQES
ncbi:MAG: peptide-methionine (S)-S-oxide reductase MsrA [Proteobacteria bacterium]|jgi:peptide-methionine (S)-S-oxide reductase|nr:peptide-methionine (S)-S-oxide reductase MsrA [Pseudomonadota bacterium]MDA1299827.1 peptide-methionine (S)-S-oxide reductase MsrA [Pseudomonadota bacterium]